MMKKYPSLIQMSSVIQVGSSKWPSVDPTLSGVVRTTEVPVGGNRNASNERSNPDHTGEE